MRWQTKIELTRIVIEVIFAALMVLAIYALIPTVLPMIYGPIPPPVCTMPLTGVAVQP